MNAGEKNIIPRVIDWFQWTVLMELGKSNKIRLIIHSNSLSPLVLQIKDIDFFGAFRPQNTTKK